MLQSGGAEFSPVKVSRLVLTRLHRSEVMVKEWGAPIGNQYYRSLMPDFPISLCGSCNKVSYYSSPCNRGSVHIVVTHTYMHAQGKNHICEMKGI